MALAAKVQAGEGICVVTLRGAVDEALLQRTGGELQAAARASDVLVLDLDEVTLLSPEPLRALLDDVEAHGAAAELVCSRPTGRRLLACWGLASRVQVHSSVEAACSARHRRLGSSPVPGAPEALRPA